MRWLGYASSILVLSALLIAFIGFHHVAQLLTPHCPKSKARDLRTDVAEHGQPGKRGQGTDYQRSITSLC